MLPRGVVAIFQLREIHQHIVFRRGAPEVIRHEILVRMLTEIVETPVGAVQIQMTVAAMGGETAQGDLGIAHPLVADITGPCPRPALIGGSARADAHRAPLGAGKGVSAAGPQDQLVELPHRAAGEEIVPQLGVPVLGTEKHLEAVLGREAFVPADVAMHRQAKVDMKAPAAGRFEPFRTGAALVGVAPRGALGVNAGRSPQIGRIAGDAQGGQIQERRPQAVTWLRIVGHPLVHRVVPGESPRPRGGSGGRALLRGDLIDEQVSMRVDIGRSEIRPWHKRGGPQGGGRGHIHHGRRGRLDAMGQVRHAAIRGVDDDRARGGAGDGHRLRAIIESAARGEDGVGGES